MKNVLGLTPFKRFCMTIGNLPATYIESLTYQELVYWLCDYIQEKVIPTINNNAGAVQELQNLFTELQNYVNNYFDNLDVQKEINNKLDEMVQNGIFENILLNYSNIFKIYSSVIDMKADKSLIEGSKISTLGYYSLNDGGESQYVIKSTQPKGYFELLDNGLFAELIVKNDTINIKQLGARPQANLQIYDIKVYIEKYMEIIDNLGKTLKLYIPAGVWGCSGVNITSEMGCNIFGDENFSLWSCKGTIITSINENQDFIFNMGTSTKKLQNWSLKNILFSTANFDYNEESLKYSFSDTIKAVKSAVNFYHASYGITDNLFFIRIKGQAMSFCSTWEIYFKLLNFRYIDNLNGSIMNFKTKDTSLETNPNITACTFENIMFENIHGNLMNFESDSSVYNCYFGNINFEDGSYPIDGGVYTYFNDDNIENFESNNNNIHHAIFNLEENSSFGDCVINSITLNNFSTKYYSINNNHYCYDTIINWGNNCKCSSIFNNISNVGMYKDAPIIKMKNITSISQHSGFPIFNNIETSSARNFRFELQGLNDIQLSEHLNLYGRPYKEGNYSEFIFLDNQGWIPVYKIKSKLSYVDSGLGNIYYDKDSLNKNRLVVIPRMLGNIDKWRYFLMFNITNKTVYLRAKVDNDLTVKLSFKNISKNDESQLFDVLGVGNYKIYTFNLPDNWEIGDQIIVNYGSSNYMYKISLDSFKP